MLSVKTGNTFYSPCVNVITIDLSLGLTLNDIDVFEINEAFASQATYCVEKLGVPMEKVISIILLKHLNRNL